MDKQKYIVGFQDLHCFNIAFHLIGCAEIVIYAFGDIVKVTVKDESVKRLMFLSMNH